MNLGSTGCCFFYLFIFFLLARCVLLKLFLCRNKLVNTVNFDEILDCEIGNGSIDSSMSSFIEKISIFRYKCESVD